MNTHAIRFSILGYVILITGAVVVAGGQGRVQTSPEIKKPTGAEVLKAPGGTAARTFTRVPNVAGMFYSDAMNALFDAGLKVNFTYLANNDPSLRRGHVSAPIPDAGTLVEPGSVVELRISGAANLMGKGNLSTADVERRMGFDLDTGRYEEMCSGADFVLLKVDKWHDPGPSYPGASQYFTSDLVISATGGAKLWNFNEVNDVREIAQHGLGSYYNYHVCEEAASPRLNNLRRNNFAISFGITHLPVAFCVQTSKKADRRS
jgi:PASTA domain